MIISRQRPMCSLQARNIAAWRPCRSQEGRIPDACQHRCQAYQELLDARTLRCTTQREIDALLGRQHSKDLLLHLPREGDFRAQSELHLTGETGQRRFRDSRLSRLSQLLGQIEVDDLIVVNPP